jgi:hypothetical protein
MNAPVAICVELVEVNIAPLAIQRVNRLDRK